MHPCTLLSLSPPVEASLCTQNSLVEPRAISTSLFLSISFREQSVPKEPLEYLCLSFLFPATTPVLYPRCHCLRQDTTTGDCCLSLCVECSALVLPHACDWSEIPTAQVMSPSALKPPIAYRDTIQILHLDTSIPSCLSCPSAAQHCQMT